MLPISPIIMPALKIGTDKVIILDSGIDAAPGITVAPFLKNFHIMILIHFLHQLLIFLSKYQGIPKFILETRVHTVRVPL